MMKTMFGGCGNVPSPDATVSVYQISHTEAALHLTQA